jgi:hypothetical protein
MPGYLQGFQPRTGLKSAPTGTTRGHPEHCRPAS